MKQFRIFLTLVLFLFAVSGAFAGPAKDLLYGDEDFKIVDQADNDDLSMTKDQILKKYGEPESEITDPAVTLGVAESVLFYIERNDGDEVLNLFFIQGKKVVAITDLYYYAKVSENKAKANLKSAAAALLSSGFTLVKDPDSADTDDGLYTSTKEGFAYLDMEKADDSDGGYQVAMTWFRDASLVTRIGPLANFIDNQDDAYDDEMLVASQDVQDGMEADINYYDTVDLSDNDEIGFTRFDLIQELGEPIMEITDKKYTQGAFDSIALYYEKPQEDDALAGGESVALYFIKNEKVATTAQLYFFEESTGSMALDTYNSTLDDLTASGYKTVKNPGASDSFETLFQGAEGFINVDYEVESDEDGGAVVSVTYAKDPMDIGKSTMIIKKIDEEYDGEVDN